MLSGSALPSLGQRVQVKDKLIKVIETAISIPENALSMLFSRLTGHSVLRIIILEVQNGFGKDRNHNRREHAAPA